MTGALGASHDVGGESGEGGEGGDAARAEVPDVAGVSGREPLRIWHVNVGHHAGPADGVAVAAARLARDQARLGHEVRLVVAADPTRHDLERRSAGTTGATATTEAAECAEGAKAPLQVTLAATPRRALEVALPLLADPGTRPHVVHLHSVFRPVHRILALRARRWGIPIVLSPHSGLAPALLRRDRLRKWVYGELVERSFHRAADGVHALQLVERDDVVRYCRAPRPVVVIPNPVDPGLLGAEPWRVPGDEGGAGGNRSRPRVVLLCRYDVYQKGLDRVDALARLLPQVDFHVHGHTDRNGPGRAAALMAHAPANLRFAPPVDGGVKPRVLREADLFLLPSRVEGLSMALVEAMALGVPCAVSSYVGRSLDMAVQGTALVLDDAPATAAAQLAGLLADRDRQARLGRAARAHARRELDPAVVAERHVEHYRTLLGAGAATLRGFSTPNLAR